MHIIYFQLLHIPDIHKYFSKNMINKIHLVSIKGAGTKLDLKGTVSVISRNAIYDSTLQTMDTNLVCRVH